MSGNPMKQVNMAVAIVAFAVKKILLRSQLQANLLSQHNQDRLRFPLIMEREHCK